MSEAFSVLLIDDHTRLRDLYRIALASEPLLEIRGEAKDGEEGARLAEDLQPDLVVLDLSMPTRDGLQALQDIKHGAPKARIVVLSGFMRERVEPLVLEMGANAYVEKGVAIEELSAAFLRVAQEAPKGPARRYAQDDLAARARELV